MESLSKVPEACFELLYCERLYDDLAVPYKEYIKRYTLIEIDGVLYGAPGEEGRAEAWSRGGVFGMTIPDAVIKGYVILKNRFGNYHPYKKEAKRATLEDLLKEKWLRERGAGNIVWKTKGGYEIPIADMSDEHLDNTIEFLKQRKEFEDVAAVYDAHISASDLG